MEISVKITTILAPQGYTKKDGSHDARYSFVGTTTNGQYDKNIKFDVWGSEAWRKMNFVVGETVTVLFDIESSEWNGKWFTNLRCWNAQRNGNQQETNEQQAATEAPAQAPTQAPAPQDDSELPF